MEFLLKFQFGHYVALCRPEERNPVRQTLRATGYLPRLNRCARYSFLHPSLLALQRTGTKKSEGKQVGKRAKSYVHVSSFRHRMGRSAIFLPSAQSKPRPAPRGIPVNSNDNWFLISKQLFYISHLKFRPEHLETDYQTRRRRIYWAPCKLFT